MPSVCGTLQRDIRMYMCPVCHQYLAVEVGVAHNCNLNGVSIVVGSRWVWLESVAGRHVCPVPNALLKGRTFMYMCLVSRH